jgi:hypothetical protein
MSLAKIRGLEESRLVVSIWNRGMREKKKKEKRKRKEKRGRFY